MGKCTSCGEWNTYVEEVIDKTPSTGPVLSTSGSRSSKPILLEEVPFEETNRIDSMDPELNRVLGGGIVPGSVVLLGGEPGIGKSTLLLQLAIMVHRKVLYVSGEESTQQIKMRAQRLGMEASNCYLLNEVATQNIFKQVEILEPDLLIIDSIQTLYSSFLDSTSGSISQLRTCTAELQKLAKESGIPVFIIGHINKEGSIAGPKVLEHMVDTVLQFEGDRHLNFRLLRSIKNRFGSTNELGIYEMRTQGLEIVNNPSQLLLSSHDHTLSGIAIGCSNEGNRPLLTEIQSLISPATYGNPQRNSTGFDMKRLSMLLAVLEKRSGYRFLANDVFLNITGGLKTDDPAVDLAVCASLISSGEEIAIPHHVCFIGEVGLTGEVRPVNKVEGRITEALKLGFSTVIIPKANLNAIAKESFKVALRGVGQISDLIKQISQFV